MNAEQPTILIIDDNPTNLRVAVDSLEESGFTVLVAQDGLSGCKRARYALPHLILLDIMMPEIDGFETCLRLKTEEITQQIPVIFMTALSSTQDKVRGFEVGAVDYITKPIQQEELLARVNTHVKMQGLTRQLQLQNQQLQQQAIELQKAKQDLESANKKLQRMANIDSLTQIANRRCFDNYLDRAWRCMAREKTSLSLILCDIDYFKYYNDFYGHQAGDICLQSVAKAIQQTVKRPQDLLARYGGEEFAVILPNTNAQGAVSVTRSIQQQIEELCLPHAASKISDCITMSFGICSHIPDSYYECKSLIFSADRALYQAKKNGRNGYHIGNIILKYDREDAILDLKHKI
jgi:diguanylate cyclase (GGDEF)-like protein